MLDDNNEPFDERTKCHDLNTELIRYSDPHCNCVTAVILTLTTRSFNVTHNADTDQWRGLDNCHGLDNLFFVDLRAGPLSLTNNVGHASFEAQKAGQMYGLGGVVLRESLDLTTMASCSLLGVEPHRPVTGGRKFAVRLKLRG